MKLCLNPSGNETVLGSELSVGHAAQHDDKTGMLMWSLLFLNDANRPNAVH